MKHIKLALAFSLFLILALTACSSEDPQVLYKKESVIELHKNDTYVIAWGADAQYSFEKSEDAMYSYMANMDNTVVVVSITQRGNYPGESELYIVTKKGKQKIAYGVLNYALADSGAGIAYIKDYDSGSQTGSLHLYDIAARKNTLISDKVAGEAGCAISPDGKTVSYITDFVEATVSFSSYIYVSGKSPVPFKDDCWPQSLSDDGKCIFYIAFENKADFDDVRFYVRYGDEDILLYDDAESMERMPITDTTVIFNTDHSQALYSGKYEDGAYLFRNGKKVKISDNELYELILPDNVQERSFTAFGQMKNVGLKDFSDFIIATSQDDLLYIDDKGKSSLIDETYSLGTAKLSQDLRTVFYCDYSNALHVKDLSGDESSKELASDVRILRSSFYGANERMLQVPPDGSGVYYVATDERQLYYLRPPEKSTKIADDVYDICLSADGQTIFFLTGLENNTGTLSRVKAGGETVKISESVCRVEANLSGIFYYYSPNSDLNNCDVYFSKNGDKFQLIANNAADNQAGSIITDSPG